MTKTREFRIGSAKVEQWRDYAIERKGPTWSHMNGKAFKPEVYKSILATYAQCGSALGTAKRLGINLKTVRRTLMRAGILPPDSRI